jgi:hypothetical protein
MAGVCKFTSTDLQLHPLLINRPLLSYTHPIILIQLSTLSSSDIINYIKQVTTNFNIGSGFSLDLLQPNFSTIKESKLYFLDMRKKSDLSNPITLKNTNVLPSWASNLIFNSLIEKVRGLIVFYDDPTTVPDIFWSRSLLTLTDSTDTTVLRNILNRAGSGLPNYPNLTGSLAEGKFRGCLKGIHWTKIVST